MFLLLLSSAYTQSRPFLLLTPLHQQGGWRCTRSREGTQPGQLTPSDQRDIPYYMASCSAYKAGGRRRTGRLFGLMEFVFSSNYYAWWSPAFLEMAEHLPADGKWWRNSLFCFACMRSFCFIYSTVFISIHEFSHFYLLILCPIPAGGEWASGCLVLSCLLGLNHNALLM